MSAGQDLVHAVPTNIITGFLGVGKTSTILHLLKNKPGRERWAVLVNEFGEIGIDGSLVEGRHGMNKALLFERSQVVACVVRLDCRCKLL